MANVERRESERGYAQRIGTWRQFGKVLLIVQFYLAVFMALASVFFGWELAVASIAIALSAVFCTLIQAAQDFRSLVVWFALWVRQQGGERTVEDSERAWRELMGELPQEWLN